MQFEMKCTLELLVVNRSIVVLGIIVVTLGLLLIYFFLYEITVPPWGPLTISGF